MRKVQFVKNHLYHIYNRGTDKRNIFEDDNDRWRFLQGLFLFNDVEVSADILIRAQRRFGKATFKNIIKVLESTKRTPLTTLVVDCLMPNHYHLIIEETKEDGISRFMQKFGTGYTMYFNKKYNRTGGLFQGPFKVVPIETQEQLEYLLFYINVLNPAQLVEANLKEEGIKNIKKVMDFVDNKFLWSTHQEFSNKRESIIIDKNSLARMGGIFSDPVLYREFIISELRQKRYLKVNNLHLE